MNTNNDKKKLSWNNNSPVKFVFGPGSISNLNSIIPKLGNRCLMVTGPNISKLEFSIRNIYF